MYQNAQKNSGYGTDSGGGSNCGPELSYILAEFFNMCLEESCFPYCWKVFRASSRKLGQHLILVKKDTFFARKVTKNFTTLYSTPFPSVLHQNSTFHNFLKREQHPITGHIKSLD